MFGLGNDNLSTVLPGLLQDFLARPCRYAAPTPGWHHAVADLDSLLRPWWPMESNVANHHTINNDLMYLPRWRLLHWASHCVMGRSHHRYRFQAVRQWIFRMPRKLRL